MAIVTMPRSRIKPIVMCWEAALLRGRGSKDDATPRGSFDMAPVAATIMSWAGGRVQAFDSSGYATSSEADYAYADRQQCSIESMG